MKPTRIFCIVLCFCVVVFLIACTSGGEGDEGFADNQWGTAQLIETGNGIVWGPQVSVDESGNAVAVWQQGVDEMGPVNIWANHYVVGTGWGTAQPIETDDSGGMLPQVGVDGNGNAIAVWQASENNQWTVWANRYVVGTGWGIAQLIGMNGNNVGSTQVSVDRSGNAVAVWSQSDGAQSNIWSNRYVVGTGWGTAELVETDDSYTAAEPQVVVNGNGNAIAVWRQDDGTWSSIWSNRYVAGTGWGTAQLVETEDNGHTYSPQVGVDGNGNAIVVWLEVVWVQGMGEVGPVNIWANRYVAETGWGTAQLIEMDDNSHASFPQVSVNRNGNAIAVWQDMQSVGPLNIWANHYVVGTGWGIPQLIETDNSGDAYLPQVGVDGSGNAVAVWWQDWNIWANRYVASTGWGTAQLIETDSGDAAEPQVGVNGSGDAVAVWIQDDGTWWNICANTCR